MRKVIFISLPDVYTKNIMRQIDEINFPKNVITYYSAESFRNDYKPGEADVIFIDETLADATITDLAKEIRNLDKKVFIVGLILTKNHEIINKFKLIPNSTVLLKLDDNRELLELLIRDPYSFTIKTSSPIAERPGKKKILVVDDFENTLYVVQFTLEEAGYQVYTAKSGMEALKILSENNDIDLAIVDLNMPKMDGFQLIEEMRRSGLFEKKPILILTTEVDPKKKERAKELKVTGWIQKPYQIDDFLGKIRRLIGN